MALPLYVTFTMDCERIAAESPPGGPETWELSEKAILGYCEVLLESGVAPTLFLTPECGQKHRELLKDLASRGVDLGMHIHPQSFDDHRYTRYLGQYSYQMQRDIIKRGMDLLAEALEIRPRSFRPGNFSASDDTFPVLSELGFQQGSVSDPGRYVPEYAAVWVNAYPYPHWANAEDRLSPGDLPFLEVPLTTDPSRRHPNGFPYELRIESGPFREWHLPIIRRALERMSSDNLSFRNLCIFTHNCFDYSDPDEDRTRTLRGILDYLDTLRDEYDVIPVTLAEMRDRFVEIADNA